jgi:hypothetical protein
MSMPMSMPPLSRDDYHWYFCAKSWSNHCRKNWCGPFVAVAALVVAALVAAAAAAVDAVASAVSRTCHYRPVERVYSSTVSVAVVSVAAAVSVADEKTVTVTTVVVVVVVVVVVWWWKKSRRKDWPSWTNCHPLVVAVDATTTTTTTTTLAATGLAKKEQRHHHNYYYSYDSCGCCYGVTHPTDPSTMYYCYSCCCCLFWESQHSHSWWHCVDS